MEVVLGFATRDDALVAAEMTWTVAQLRDAAQAVLGVDVGVPLALHTEDGVALDNDDAILMDVGLVVGDRVHVGVPPEVLARERLSMEGVELDDVTLGREVILAADRSDAARCQLIIAADVLRGEGFLTEALTACMTQNKFNTPAEVDVLDALLRGGAEPRVYIDFYASSQTVFCIVVGLRRLDLLRMFVNAPGFRTHPSDTVIHTAYGWYAGVEVLLAAGVPPDARHKATSDTMLTRALIDEEAAPEERLAMARLLVRHGASASDTLRYAGHHGREDILRILTDTLGADLTRPDLFGKTILHHAAESGHVNMLDIGVRGGVAVDHQDTTGNTALHYAAQMNQRDAAAKLLEHADGARCLAMANKDGDTPLHTACTYAGTSPETALLLAQQRGVRVNAKNKANCTPLELCARMTCSTALAGLLHETLEARLGDALRIAAGRGVMELVEVLLRSAGPEINAAARDGRTALHHACGEGRRDVVRLLVDSGADPTRGAETPLHCAARGGYEDIVAELLDDARVEVDARAPCGGTPLHFATYAANFSAFRVLLCRGADPGIRDNQGRDVHALVAGRAQLERILRDPSDATAPEVDAVFDGDSEGADSDCGDLEAFF